MPFVGDVFGQEADAKAEQIVQNLLQQMSKAADPHVLDLLHRNLQLLASGKRGKLDKHLAEVLSRAGERLKAKDLSPESRNAVINCVRAVLSAASKASVETSGQKIVDLFEKGKSGKESLACYHLISTLYEVIAKHSVTSMESQVSTTCQDLIEAASSKSVELKVKKTVIESFGPLIALRGVIGDKRLISLLEVILSSLGLEALHFPCISALENFSSAGQATQNKQIDTIVNQIIEKLVDLFAAKNKVYQVNIMKVFEAFHKNSILTISEANKQRILQGFCGLLERCDISTVKLIAEFILKFQQAYRGFTQEIGQAIQTMRNLALFSSPDDEFLETLVSFHKTFIPAEEYEKTIYKVYEQTKKDPNTEVTQASLFLYFMFQSLPDLNKLVQEIAEEVVSKRSANFCLSLGLLSHLGYLKDLSKHDKLMAVVHEACSSTEAKVKLSGIKCLTGLGVSDLDNFRSIFNSIIPKNVETRMFFFTSVQSIFQYLSPNAPADCTVKFLAYLHEFVEVVEDSEEAELFKAYGKVIKRNVALIEPTFKKLASAPKGVYKVLGASICKQIFDKDLDLDAYPTAKDLLSTSINSVDPEVETAAFISLDAIHCSNPRSIEKLLNMQFCHTMAQKMLTNQALVEKIEMGLFSHKIDNGLPLRKACFSFLYRLCKAELFNLQPFLSAVIAGLGDENEDVKYLAIRVLKEGVLEQGHSYLLSEFGQDLASSLEKSLKSFKAKATNIMQEKGANYHSLKSLIALINDLSRSQAFSTNSQIKAMETDILNTPAFKDVIVQ